MSAPLQVTITFEEHEARFLGALVDASAPRLSASQRVIAHGIAGKFLEAARPAIEALIAEHGLEGAERIAQRIIDRHPEADTGALA